MKKTHINLIATNHTNKTHRGAQTFDQLMYTARQKGAKRREFEMFVDKNAFYLFKYLFFRNI